MKRMTGRLAAALIAALVVVPTAMADDDHGSKKKHDELEISVVSSPAKYVSGGDARGSRSRCRPRRISTTST